jgi:2',3'-cyclic-nucleotide 2'-phosphodiesterase (5'-nucleotidase family)
MITTTRLRSLVPACLLALLGVGFIGCAGHAPPAVLAPVAPAADRTVHVTLLQINDVYEITPSAANEGGLARVAGLLTKLKASRPNVLAVLAGDFLSPSALSTAKVDGARLDGKQMIEVLNALPLDWATFGNHEFDLKEDAFRARVAAPKRPSSRPSPTVAATAFGSAGWAPRSATTTPTTWISWSRAKA